MTFVVFQNPRMHLFTRGVAAFVFAPYLMYAGYRCRNWFVFAIGLATLLFDTYTWWLTLRLLRRRRK